MFIQCIRISFGDISSRHLKSLKILEEVLSIYNKADKPTVFAKTFNSSRRT